MQIQTNLDHVAENNRFQANFDADTTNVRNSWPISFVSSASNRNSYVPWSVTSSHFHNPKSRRYYILRFCQGFTTENTTTNSVIWASRKNVKGSTCTKRDKKCAWRLNIGEILQDIITKGLEKQLITQINPHRYPLPFPRVQKGKKSPNFTSFV